MLLLIVTTYDLLVTSYQLQGTDVPHFDTGMEEFMISGPDKTFWQSHQLLKV